MIGEVWFDWLGWNLKVAPFNIDFTHLSHHKTTHKTTRKPSTKPQEPIAYKATLIALEKKHCELKLFCLTSMR